MRPRSLPVFLGVVGAVLAIVAVGAGGPVGCGHDDLTGLDGRNGPDAQSELDAGNGVDAANGTETGPDIEVVPAQLNFGLVSLLAPSRRTLLITNVGFEPLQIFDLRFETSVSSFSVASVPSVPFSLQAGDVVAVDLDFWPERTDGPVETRLIIESSDPDEPRVEVLLRAEHMTPPRCPVTVTPTKIAFGAVPTRQTTSLTLTLTNEADVTPCLITGFQLSDASNSAFMLVTDGWSSTSTLIEPGESVSAQVRVTPRRAGLLQGELTFGVSDPEQPFRSVVLTATATGD